MLFVVRFRDASATKINIYSGEWVYIEFCEIAWICMQSCMDIFDNEFICHHQYRSFSGGTVDLELNKGKLKTFIAF